MSHGANWFANYWGQFQSESSWVRAILFQGLEGEHGAPLQSGKPLKGTTLSLRPGGEGIPGPMKGKPQLGRWGTMPLGPGLTSAQGFLAEHLLCAGPVKFRHVPHFLGLSVQSRWLTGLQAPCPQRLGLVYCCILDPGTVIRT